MERLRRISNSFNHSTGAGGPSGFFGLVCGFGYFTKRKSHGERNNFNSETVGISGRRSRDYGRESQNVCVHCATRPGSCDWVGVGWNCLDTFLPCNIEAEPSGFQVIRCVQAPLVLASNWTIPGEYLKVRRKYGWSPWPVYCLWPCLVGGIVCLVLGLFRL